MLTKPRFGRRRYIGICPPSNPLSATPVRAFWPLTPLPEVLPLPEPMPRPRRFDFSRTPGLSRKWLSFMSGQLLHLQEVGHLADHAAHRRRVFELARPPQLVEAE